MRIYSVSWAIPSITFGMLPPLLLALLAVFFLLLHFGKYLLPQTSLTVITKSVRLGQHTISVSRFRITLW
jgi:hypothetical protein